MHNSVNLLFVQPAQTAQILLLYILHKFSFGFLAIITNKGRMGWRERAYPFEDVLYIYKEAHAGRRRARREPGRKSAGALDQMHARTPDSSGDRDAKRKKTQARRPDQSGARRSTSEGPERRRAPEDQHAGGISAGRKQKKIKMIPLLL